ncbi:aspartate/glutamate racemase family protein [Pseudovibrio sp. Alg231-02]|uniref:aspartate/glutamate racemase family protein n=1 Tax=Pseudovibrio sp. Alg231-02 TaxID=1922223 RepID=UPI000D555C03|nr:aspartate/glutamate racemase family protein [Pseudovibrio sp. Alg231-02]
MINGTVPHLGLIGGIGFSATNFYHRRLCEMHSELGINLDLTIAHADLRTLMLNLENCATTAQVRIFKALIGRLRKAGANKVAITAMSGHFCLQELDACSPLPIVDGLAAINEYLQSRSLQKVGIIGTLPIMQRKLFERISSAEVIAPLSDRALIVDSIYDSIAANGIATNEEREALFEIGRDLCVQNGAQAVLLAGTDFFVAFDGQHCGFTAIDCAEVHIRAIMRGLSSHYALRDNL